ncbi:hypothetical protein D3C85_519130 [compost metagenome]
MADQIGQRQGQRQADQEAFAAGQGLGVAGDIGLPGVDHFQFQLAAAAPRQLVAAVQTLELLVGQVDQVIEGQALGELAVLGAVGRADQAVELLPEVVVDLLGGNLGEQALQILPPRLVALQLRADFALALGQGFQLGAEQLQALFELLALEFAGRIGLQGSQLLVGGGFQRLGLGQRFVQTLLELNQRSALLLVEQRGLEGALVAERAGGQGGRPLLRFGLQVVLILAQPLRLGLLAAVQLLLTTLLLG